MDKEVANHKTSGAPIDFRLSKSELPGQEGILKASVSQRETVGIEQLAANLVESSCGLKKETLVMAYCMMNSEIYKCVEKGFNVDFGIGRTDVSLTGPFRNLHQAFDPKVHAAVARLYPSARMRQIVANLPVHNITTYLGNNSPKPEKIWTNTVHGLPDNTLPAGIACTAFINGRRLKLLGDLPEVGVRLCCPATDEEIWIEPWMVSPNQVGMLCFRTPPLSEGEWEVSVTSQYNPSYRLYKKARTGVMAFTVQVC